MDGWMGRPSEMSVRIVLSWLKNFRLETGMTDATTSRSSAFDVFSTRLFFEKLLLATAVPAWLGVAVWLAWIDLNQLYVIFVVIYTILVLLLFVSRYVRSYVSSNPVVSQVGFLIFVGLPVFAFIMYAVFSTFNNFVIVDFTRCLFIMLCLLLPSGLYYLFVGSRRDSLLNAFIVLIDRLGLFDYRRLFSSPAFVSSAPAPIQPPSTGKAVAITETEFSRGRRVRSYFERFEAIYGPLPQGFIKDIVDSTKPDVKTGDASSRVAPNYDVPLSVRHMSPVILLVGLSFIGWITILPPIQHDQSPLFPYINETPTAVGFAFLGAYFFTLQFLVWRFIRKDLSSNAYVSMSLRMVLAVIGVYALGEVLNAVNLQLPPTALNSLAFAVGAFPMIVWEMMTSFAKRYSGIGFVLPTMNRGIPLSELDGMTIWHETRLQDEDIENVVNFASADVIDLFLNTRFAPNRIIDWIDQAILLSIISGSQPSDDNPLKSKIYAAGLRSITSMNAALSMKTPALPALDTDVDLGAGLTQPLRIMMSLISEIAETYPNFALVETWKGVGRPA
jgi:hypothetical protein